jgi:hypothetical protein
MSTNGRFGVKFSLVIDTNCHFGYHFGERQKIMVVEEPHLFYHRLKGLPALPGDHRGQPGEYEQKKK